MAGQVRAAGLQIFKAGHAQLCLGAAAVVLERAHRGNDHNGGGLDAGQAALDVEEFFRAQVRAEARLGDDIICQLHAQLCGDDAVAAVGDVGERPAVHQRGRVLQRLHQVWVKSVLQQRGHGARRADLLRRDGRARIRVAHYDAAQAGLQVGQIGGKAENGHHLACNGDVEAVLTRRAVGLAAQAVGDEAELAVVHVYAALPGDAPRIDVQRVALINMVVHHGGQQIVGRADGVKIACEVQVDVLHGHHLCIPAACGAALYAEHGAEAGLPQREDDVFAHSVQRVRQAHAGGGFALARGRGADGRYKNDFGVLFFGQLFHKAVVHLGLVLSVGDQALTVQPQRRGHVGNGFQNGFLRDLDIGFHANAPFFTPVFAARVKYTRRSHKILTNF